MDLPGPAPIAISDRAKTFDEELAVAQELIVAGNPAEAMEHLRIASTLVPNLAADHLRLGKALLEAGDREKALSSMRAAVQLDPDNPQGWQVFGDAQLGSGLYGEAVESYRHLIGGQPTVGRLTESQRAFWLNYADALRMSGRAEEASLAFGRVYEPRAESIAGSATVKHASPQNQKRPAPSNVPMPRVREVHAAQAPLNIARLDTRAYFPNPAVTSPVAITRRVNEQRPDELFSEGLRLLKGRDPRSLQRAELVRALELFQFASQGGAHRVEANRYAAQLGKEFDRRKKW
jgi:tetratricopeptide (TPR) repeat protein